MDYDTAKYLFRYVPETGQLYWRRAGIKRNLFRPAGCFDARGYGRISYEHKKYLLHRIIWLLHTGEWPEQEIDHIDGNKQNNKIENLREVSPKENSQAYWRQQCQH